MTTVGDPRPGQDDARQVNPWRIFGYFSLLLVIANFVSPTGALAQLPIQFYIKDHLKLSPSQSAQFSLIMFVPLYGAFLFGMIRDRWSPFSLGDRGFFLLFGPIAALAYAFLAFRHGSYTEMLTGALTIMFVYRLIGPAIAGLTATVGQRLAMTGRLSSLVQVVGNVLGTVMAYLSGWVQLHLSKEQIFLCLAGSAICLFLAGLIRPRGVFAEGPIETREMRHFGKDIWILLCHRPLWPALAIWLTWAFGPGQATPLFYQLTNVIHMNEEQVGRYNAIGAATFIPGALLYGALCRFVSPNKLLIIATVFAVPQMLPLNYINSANGAYLASSLVGIVGGMAVTSYYDLLLRSCPKGFEATTIELGITLAVLVDRFGNLLGSHLYERPHGFELCNWLTAAAYALILPMIRLIPKSTLAHRDAEV